MGQFLQTVLGAQGFEPHGYCFLWTRPLLWLYVISDSLITVSYYSIPIALIYFVRKRRDLAFNRVFLMFAVFIIACGTTHLMALWTLWTPLYWLDAGVKAVTAAASLATAVALWPLIPKALALPSPAQLEAANVALQGEIIERNQVQEALHAAHDELELRVHERTRELARTTETLRAEIAERKRAEQYLAIQFGVTRILTESATFEEATPKLLLSICEGVGWELGELWRVNHASKLMCWEGIWHRPSLNVREFEAISRETTFSPGIGLPGRVWASGRPAWISDVASDGNFLRGTVAANLGLRAAFAFPIGNGNGVTGVMAFFGSEIREPDDYLLNMMAELGIRINLFIERCQAESALRQSEERYRDLVENANDIIFTLDLTQDLTSLNRAGEMLSGYTRDEVLGMHISQVLAPEHLDLIRHMLDRKVREGGATTYEVDLVAKGGNRVPVEVSTRLIYKDGIPMGVQGVARDITERKRAEATRQALYQASLEIQEPQGLQQRLDRLLQAAQGVLELDRVNIFLADPEGHWLQAVASLGVEEPLEVIRVPIGPAGGSVAQAYLTQRMIAWNGQGPVPESLRLHPPYDRITALRSKVFVNVPLLIQGRAIGVLGADRKRSRRPLDEATKETLQLFAAQAALAIEHGQLYEAQRMAAIHLEATVEDRTRELRAANAQLQEATRLAEAASRHKSEFLANMSHELRTPLNSILGFSGLMQQHTHDPLTVKQARHIEHIHSSGKHLLALINDLLDLSKVEAGRLDLRPQAFDLPAVLTAAVSQIRPQAEEKDLELSLKVDEAPSTLIADPLRFKQILFNLLSNAVKFTPNRGAIIVTARRVPGSAFRVPSSRPQAETTIPGTWNLEPGTASVSEFVEISVQDTGIGIKTEDLPKLFQPFSQLESKLVGRYQGTGLGLALTKRLVKLHGGSIWAESAGEGLGSTFTIWLPMIPPDAIAGRRGHDEASSLPRP